MAPSANAQSPIIPVKSTSKQQQAGEDKKTEYKVGDSERYFADLALSERQIVDFEQ